jgi:hypothetical protein
MERRNGIEIAQALIHRYGSQAQAIAEERAATMSEEDPGIRHIWDQVPVLGGASYDRTWVMAD